MKYFDQLREKQSLVATKKGKEGTGSVSVAVSRSGNEYFVGSVSSDSKLTSALSEHVALSCAKNRNDLMITEVYTLLGSANDQSALLLAVKILVDHAVRTGLPIAYNVASYSGDVVFSSEDVRREVPFYKPKVSQLIERLKVAPSKNVVILSEAADVLQELKKCALEGVSRNFPAYDLASGYGVSVLLDDGRVVFGGQYGSLEGRLGLHAEMSVILDVLMNFPGAKIEKLGIVSTKYLDIPCEICGNCLQFLAEITSRYNWDIKYYTFAAESDVHAVYSLADLLPRRWTSKKW